MSTNGFIDLTGDSSSEEESMGVSRVPEAPTKKRPRTSNTSIEEIDVDAVAPNGAAPVVSGADAVQSVEDVDAPKPKLKKEYLAELEAELVGAATKVESLEYALADARRRQNALSRRIRAARAAQAEQADSALDWTRARPWDADLLRVCRDTLGAPTFRPLQREALNGTLARRDVFAVMPTGAGKSLIYQAAALVDGGITLVISPLIALSADQRTRLAERGVNAAALDSKTSPEDVSYVFSEFLPARGVAGARGLRKRLRAGDALASAGDPATWTKDDMPACILFVTPERIVKSKRLMSRLEVAYEAGHLSRIAIDEAHCCSQWGHDFRPDYANIGVMRRQLPEVPILMLSATAAPRVIEEVKTILGTPQCVVFRTSIDRPNLMYGVQMLQKGQTPGMVAGDLAEGRFRGKCGIVYVLSRLNSTGIARDLRGRNVAAAAYHGDLEPEEREKVYSDWMSGKVRVVVATIAFGLGIDNQNVRFVIHACIPPSLEAYYQESGRAGRDGKAADCVVLFQASDFSRMSCFVADKGPTRLKLLYEMAKYTLGLGKCRRQMLAAAFREGKPKRSGEDLATCCDLCASRGDKLEMVDVSGEARSLVQILDYAGTKYPDDKITITRAALDWSNTGAKGKRFRGPDLPPLGRHCDKETKVLIVIVLIIHGVLREYHNYNMYSMNGYVAVGSNAQLLLDEKLSVSIPLSAKVAKAVRAGQLTAK